MAKHVTLIPVQPTGHHMAMSFVDYDDRPGDLRQMLTFDYPASPRGESLRLSRVEADVSLRDGAAMLGITVVEFSKLECGKLDLSDADWDVALRPFRRPA